MLDVHWEVVFVIVKVTLYVPAEVYVCEGGVADVEV
jgi:hypothetical protein